MSASFAAGHKRASREDNLSELHLKAAQLGKYRDKRTRLKAPAGWYQ